MKVIQIYPVTGQARVLMDDIRFPNGPLSDSLEDKITFLEWNIENLRNVIKTMPADKTRQDAIMQLDTQKQMLNELKREQNKRLVSLLDKNRR